MQALKPERKGLVADLLAGLTFPVVREQLAKTGMLARLGAQNLFPATTQLGEALNQAIAAANEWLEEAD